MYNSWLRAALVRAVRSFAQGALGAIGSGAVFSQIHWLTVLGTGVLAAILSFLMSLAGLGEVGGRAFPGGEGRDISRDEKKAPEFTEKRGDDGGEGL